MKHIVQTTIEEGTYNNIVKNLKDETKDDIHRENNLYVKNATLPESCKRAKAYKETIRNATT